VGFTKAVQALAFHACVEEALQGMRINDKPAVFNHIIGTLYVEQNDEIGAHKHKMLDIRGCSNIISLSLGDAKEFVLTSEAGDEQQTVVLENGDLFVLGPATNAHLKHVVLPGKAERIIERSGAAAAPPISIVLRDIKTQLSRAQVTAKIAQSERGKGRARQARQTLSQRPDAKQQNESPVQKMHLSSCFMYKCK
jgi:2OG-Fe(II) oxygenase superfamily